MRKEIFYNAVISWTSPPVSVVDADLEVFHMLIFTFKDDIIIKIIKNFFTAFLNCMFANDCIEHSVFVIVIGALSSRLRTGLSSSRSRSGCLSSRASPSSCCIDVREGWRWFKSSPDSAASPVSAASQQFFLAFFEL